MSVWFRAAIKEDAKEVFSGDGGVFVAGRWNHKGMKAIYCSESLSLCTLEWLSHNGLTVSGFNYYKFSIEIPDNLITRFEVSDLPKNWWQVPSPEVNRDIAEKKFFTPRHYLAMAVPSVMVPEEYNLIINPLHLAFTEVASSILSLGEFTAPHRG